MVVLVMDGGCADELNRYVFWREGPPCQNRKFLRGKRTLLSGKLHPFVKAHPLAGNAVEDFADGFPFLWSLGCV